MNIEKFIQSFAAQFEETEASTFKADTKFKDLDEWSSLTALSVIAMVDEEYSTLIKGDDIRNASTIEELFNLVKAKQ